MHYNSNGIIMPLCMHMQMHAYCPLDFYEYGDNSACTDFCPLAIGNN